MPTANTLTVHGKVINIAFDGSTNDIDFATYFPNGIKVAGIGFVASAASDVLVLKDRTDSRNVVAEIFGTGSIALAESVWMHLYLDYSACIIGTPASAKVIIHIV